jgi:hypothetical protein
MMLLGWNTISQKHSTINFQIVAREALDVLFATLQL